MEKNKINFALRVWYFRTQKGLTQDELAKITGCSQAIIAKIESGKRELSVDVAIKLAKALGISLDTLFADEITITI